MCILPSYLLFYTCNPCQHFASYTQCVSCFYARTSSEWESAHECSRGNDICSPPEQERSRDMGCKYPAPHSHRRIHGWSCFVYNFCSEKSTTVLLACAWFYCLVARNKR